MKKSAFLIWILSTLILTFSISAQTPQETQLKVLKEAIQSTVKGSHTDLPAFESLDSIHDFLDKFETAIRSNDFIKSDMKNSAMIQDIYEQAYLMALLGRGNTTQRDGTGWMYDRHAGDIDEVLSRIQNARAFDEAGKQRLINTLNDIDPTSDEFVKSRGFPPGFEILSQDSLESVISSLESAPVRKQAYDEPQIAEALSDLKTLIDSTKDIDGNTKKALYAFIGGIENNIYDESIKTLQDPNKDFINYYGRQQELEEIVEGFSRLEKGHILITGKAGVGKTTILKMLQDKLIQGEIFIADEAAPIILELPITDITNEQDPTVLKSKINAAALLAEKLDRRVILYVDEAHVATKINKNSIKGFLTEKLNIKNLHFVWSTTSNESKAFLKDKAFARRWVKVHASEFSEAESIELVKQSFLSQWRKHHQLNGVQFHSISEKAFEFAARHYRFEQPDAANPTGMKEFLEGAIARKKRVLAQKGEKGKFSVELKDLRDYLKSRAKMELIPGDEDFDKIFNEKWAALTEDYVGNEYYLYQLRKDLYSFFSTFKRNKVPSFINFGAPGVGKSYILELVSKHFFGGGLLILNAAEYKNGGLEVNKLIDPPPGTVGYDENGGELSTALKENPVLLIGIEEGDYMHQDFVQLFTNIISNQEVKDSHGITYKADQVMIMVNSNKGQEFMVAPNNKNKMNWEQFQIRKSGLVEKVDIGGVLYEKPKPEILNDIFDDYFKTIVTNSNKGEDTALASQEAVKQKRRYKARYVLSPDRGDLIKAAKNRIKKLRREFMLDFEVEINLSEEHAEKLLELDKYDFNQAYTYVDHMINDRVFDPLKKFVNQEGAVLNIDFNFENPRNTVMIVEGNQGISESIPLGEVSLKKKSPWASSETMLKRIRNLTGLMKPQLLGMDHVIKGLQATLKSKVIDWNTKTTQVLVGTTGNGKTETGKALARTLFGTDDAWFRIEASHPHHLNNYFRPPVAYKGSNEETDFERWFNSRKNAGGGVIIFDEILSFDGLRGQALEDKIRVFNELYTFFDEQTLRIANKTEDARAFIPIVTGNALQEVFDGIDDNPEYEKLIDFVLEHTDVEDAALQYFKQRGFDAPKLARIMKNFYLVGPLSRENSLKVAKIKINAAIKKFKEALDSSVEIVYSDEIAKGIVERVSTVKLGMRKAEIAVDKIIKEPLNGIAFDIMEDIKKVEVDLVDGRVQWKVNGKAVELGSAENQYWDFKDQLETTEYKTPQLKDIEKAKKTVFSEKDIAEVAEHEGPGHWMTDTLLHGKNNSMAVNINAGYQRPIPRKDMVKSITTIFKEMIILQAGNRAVIRKGLFAYGGGGEGRSKEGERRSDDLGRVNEHIDNIAKNQLFEDYTEFTEKNKMNVFKVTLRNLSIYAADAVIEYGVEIGIDKEVRELSIKNRYVSQAELDDIVKNYEGKMKPKELVYMEAVESALDTTLDKSRRLGEKANEETKYVLREFVEKSTTEFSYLNPELKDKLESLKEKMINKIDAFKYDCNGLYNN